jgi:HK97 family phage prohead protease
METKNHIFNIKSFESDGSFKGYASVFNNVDLQQELVMPGAFNKSLKKWQLSQQLPKMLWQHDPKIPIGLWKSIQENEHGLFVEGKLLLEIRQGQEAYTLLKAGIVDGLSIGYDVIKAQRHNKHRVLQEIDLHEISLVTFAANPAAKVVAHKQMLLDSQKLDLLVQRFKKLEAMFFQKSMSCP